MDLINREALDPLHAEFISANDTYMDFTGQFPFPLYHQHPEYRRIKQRLDTALAALLERRRKERPPK